MRDWNKMLIALAIGLLLMLEPGVRPAATETQAAENSAAQQHDRRDSFLRRQESGNF